MGGYCYLNNAAIAAQYLVDQGRARVAILDVDYHHGNGTQEIFYSAGSDVLFVSLHADPRVEYPYFLGYADELGAGAGVGFTHNYPLPHGTTWEAYGPALDDACAKVEAFRPDALVVSLGVDTYEHDPISQFRLRTEDFPKHRRAHRRRPLPTLVRDGRRLRRRGHRRQCRQRADRLRLSSVARRTARLRSDTTSPHPSSSNRERSDTRSSARHDEHDPRPHPLRLRMLIRRPGLSASAIIALALGIGLTTTMFSIVYVAVIRAARSRAPTGWWRYSATAPRKAWSSWA